MRSWTSVCRMVQENEEARKLLLHSLKTDIYARIRGQSQGAKALAVRSILNLWRVVGEELLCK